MTAHASHRPWSAPIANGRGALLDVPAGEVCTALVFLLTFIIASDGSWSTVVSGLFPTLLLCPAIYLLARAQGWHDFNILRAAAPLAVVLFGFMLIAAVSTAVNPFPEDDLLPLLGSYVAPFLLFVVYASVQMDRSQFERLLILVAAGALIPLVWGASEFYREWGIPTGVDLLMSRYKLDRMEGYMSKTFGNTGNMAAYLAILIPSMGAAWFALRGRLAARLLLLAVLAMSMLHVLIVQSRTLFIVLVLCFPLISVFYRLRFGTVAFVLMLGTVAILIPVLTAVDQFLELTVGAVSGEGNSNGDQSVSERFEAMSAGIQIIKDHIALGVGPGNSLLKNPFTSAHEYWIQQGSEIGIMGLVLAVALTFGCIARLIALFPARALDPACGLRFAMVIGPATYLIYGVLANMPLSENVMTTWIGLTALLLGASFMKVSALPRRTTAQRRT